MSKPIFVIQYGGRLSDHAFAEMKKAIPEGLSNEYHMMVVDGAEYTKCSLFNGDKDDIEDLKDYFKKRYER